MNISNMATNNNDLLQKAQAEVTDYINKYNESKTEIDILKINQTNEMNSLLETHVEIQLELYKKKDEFYKLCLGAQNARIVLLEEKLKQRTQNVASTLTPIQEKLEKPTTTPTKKPSTVTPTEKPTTTPTEKPEPTEKPSV